MPRPSNASGPPRSRITACKLTADEDRALDWLAAELGASRSELLRVLAPLALRLHAAAVATGDATGEAAP